jgi:hypothetical protein
MIRAAAARHTQQTHLESFLSDLIESLELGVDVEAWLAKLAQEAA